MKKILFLTSVVFLAISCKKDSSEIDQNTIFQNYIMTYDEEEDQTTISAYFYEDKLNGKNLELTGGSAITMNGEAMNKNGSVYTKTIAGNLASASMLFTDADGKTFANTISKANAIGNDNIVYLNKNFTGYWYWSGNTIASGETINLTLTNVADNTKYSSFSETVLGRDYVQLNASSLTTLPDGNAKVTISRTKESASGNFTSVGGKITSIYKGLYNYVEIY